MTKRIGLFIPCYIDKFYPNVALATLRLLKKFDFDVKYPFEQTCCGQPSANTGCENDTKKLALRFVEIFKEFDYIVAPSASCVSMVKNHYEEYIKPTDEYRHIQKNIYEISEFLTDVVKVKELDVSFPHKVGFHQSCHGLRELNLGVSSELNLPYYSKPLSLLKLVKDIEIVKLKRADECCGFGGTFSINEPEISIRMGKDRIKDHLEAGAEYIVGYDSSCLMHLEGIIKSEGYDIKIAHIAEVLAGTVDAS
ncbi:MAG: (Fe-S)-binding protein [Epsilonproteobacteria bacterium]|nr:(Fe-S)-binding protein [Campylobacterota bacterium]